MLSIICPAKGDFTWFASYEKRFLSLSLSLSLSECLGYELIE